MSFDINIFSPKDGYKKNATKVILPGGEGQIGILPGHARLITYLAPGVIKVAGEGFEEYIDIGFGVMEVHPGGVTLITEEILKRD